MKDFEEFRKFLLQDCRHEIDAIGQKMAYTFTDADFAKTTLSVEALGTLLKIVSWQTAQFVMLAFERFYEWDKTFPDDNPSDPE